MGGGGGGGSKYTLIHAHLFPHMCICVLVCAWRIWVYVRACLRAHLCMSAYVCDCCMPVCVRANICAESIESDCDESPSLLPD